MKTHHTDILIIGGGLVGTSLAIALSSSFKVTVLEKQTPDLSQPFDVNSRPISLSYRSYQILNEMGVWAALKDYASPIRKVHVSSTGDLGSTCFKAEEEHLAALGFVVPFDVLHKTLFKKMQEQKNIHLQAIDTLHAMDYRDSKTEVSASLKDQSFHFSADLLMGCDGTHSRVRELAKIEVKTDHYQKIALTGRVQLKRSHDYTAYERFSKEGIIAFLPLKEEKECAFVWSVDKDFYEKLNQDDRAVFLKKLQHHFGYRLGKIMSAERLAHFPLTSLIAAHPIRPGLVLVGNAAHTLLPIAAQGFNLSLRDAQTLHELLRKAKTNGESIQSFALLERYLAERMSDQQAVATLIQRVMTIYDSNWPGIKVLRSAGLMLTDLCFPLKKRLARQAIGFV